MRLCHRRHPSGLHLSLWRRQERWIWWYRLFQQLIVVPGTGNSLMVWDQAIAIARCEEWGGARGRVPACVSCLAQSLSHYQRCSGASQNWDLFAAVVFRTLLRVPCQNHWCCFILYWHSDTPEPCIGSPAAVHIRLLLPEVRLQLQFWLQTVVNLVVSGKSYPLSLFIKSCYKFVWWCSQRSYLVCFVMPFTCD